MMLCYYCLLAIYLEHSVILQHIVKYTYQQACFSYLGLDGSICHKRLVARYKVFMSQSIGVLFVYVLYIILHNRNT
jgi:prepilin signal peptidase PulO-like enzyme (type II secretory pathway)